ncbi:MAG: ParA family protein [Armatimonadota bacterium]
MGSILCVVNQKGGVGKTTTAVNVAASAADLGVRTLLIDLDPQGNASSGLGIDRAALERCVRDLLLQPRDAEDGLAVQDVVVASGVQRLDLVPATIDLAAADLVLASEMARETKLRAVLEPCRQDYDLILIDTGPSLGVLTINSLVAADSVLIPIQCEYYALEGLSQLVKVIDLVQQDLNPRLRICGVVLTMYDGRTTLSKQVAAEVRKWFPGQVFTSTIPRNVRLAEAPSHGLPCVRYDSASRGARAYRQLCREVLANA